MASALAALGLCFAAAPGCLLAPEEGAPADNRGTSASSASPLIAITPNNVPVGSGDTTITVLGAGFLPSSWIRFASEPLETTYVDGSTLRANIPAALTGRVGVYPIYVITGAEEGGTSPGFAFLVTSPDSALTSLAPTTAKAGSGPLTISVTGNNFTAGAVVTLNGTRLTTRFTSETQVDADVPAPLLASPGTFPVAVVSAAGAPTAPIDFVVEDGAPTLASVSPASLTASAGDTTLTLTGSNFRAGVSLAKSGNQTLSTTVQSETQLTALVPASLLASAGSLPIAVSNTGGGSSAVLNVPINCSTGGVDIALTAVGQTVSKASNLTVSMRSFKDNTSCPAQFLNIDEKSRGYVVQNQTNAPAVLSAWAVCNNTANDAFLTFYRRSTVPTTSNDLLTCTPTISEGRRGFGGYASPESNGGDWCPGLTKGNGGGITLAACEKVVVFMQEYDVGLGPGTLKAKLEAP